MGTGIRMWTGRTEKRRRSARNRTRLVDDMRETVESGWKEEKRRKERTVAFNPDNLKSNNEAGEGA